VGGAIVPLLMGFAADHVGLSLALLVPAACYIWIWVYGLFTMRHGIPEGGEADRPGACVIRLRTNAGEPI
jgi:FHS family L-fucose permease-like MFS transporter